QILSLACDNALANNKMIVRHSRILPVFRGERMRIRCFLHIVNLIAKVIIYQFDAPKASKGGPEVEEDD
ncbi:hypothetical protein BC827DRAFT_1094535, partial [Russula dissimulans]